ncbi:Glycosyltransferase involved in cell wall bisynthesis [Georgenia satyanarayanai]|uniref:Glycosyltransferase involved in cell wall bisynthesis n=1 Tax=Georgenia satyanarayanai TaxID=860221 RepID=A0A2Y9AFF8_9MICO|nr:glycosyltransferase [Georgenia satyanarayanai]PYF99392.1 glycosyltransferase involved in cell wall biosynthesis [Georgenia satyanarayanai]SSA43204.1 Glycosyltransferase involved in cell wall bisynthesis [Georgenia satyanarayanai]
MTSQRPSVLVVTVVHHPQDARIRHRQVPALLAAGWDVTYAAPFRGYDLPVPPDATHGAGRLHCVDVPRATGRRRLRALRDARRLVRGLGRAHDVVLVHDPELLLAVPRSLRPRAVWDVHEDTAAAVVAKPWLPRPARAVAAGLVRRAERWAERRLTLLLAEYGYRKRFTREHVVVPNTVPVPADAPVPGTDRAVYLGSITLERGALEVVETGRLLRERTAGALTTHVVGPAHGPAEALVREAHERGDVHWHGFVPNDRAGELLDGALAGLSLLQDLPNYRHSMPTKVLEYMAHGVPVVTTPLPLARDVVTTAGSGVVVPFADPAAAADAVLALRAAPGRAADLGAAGRRAARERYDWATVSDDFVAALRGAARR